MTDKDKKPVGRPTKYSKKLVDDICGLIVDGLSVREISRREDMPAMSTIFSWLDKYEDFAEQYARAKDMQIEMMAEEILDIADDAQNDWMERRNEDGEVIGEVVRAEHITRSRVRIDARKWLMGKLKPKKYGDKVVQEVTGKDGGAIQHQHEVSASDKLKGMLDGIAGRKKGD